MKAPRLPPLLRRTLRIAVLCAAALGGFAATVALLLLFLSWVPGAPDVGSRSVPLAVLCGLVAWLFVAVFHIRRETRHLTVGDRDTFADRLTTVLNDLGYEVTRGPDGRYLSRPRFWSPLVGGRLEVVVDGPRARATGPRLFVELVRRRLRLDTHIARARQAVRDPRARDGDRLVKRVELALRFPAAHWEAVRDEVVRALERARVEVVCQVQLLATSEAGIREQVIEHDIPARLRPLGIRLEVRKDFPAWEEPPVEPDRPEDGTTSVVI
jgi:hypothetical protein